jgi:hypothetical protein
MLHSYFTPAEICMYIYALLVLTPASPVLIYVTAVILFYLHLLIYTPDLLVLYSYFSCCVCVCESRLTGLVECVEQSEGLRRDGACEHGVLQQRAAGEAAPHEPPHACLLMHVGSVQARTRLQERQRVHRAAHWGRFDQKEHVSTVTQVRCRVLGG